MEGYFAIEREAEGIVSTLMDGLAGFCRDGLAVAPVYGGFDGIEVAALILRLAQAHTHSVRTPAEFVREEFVTGNLYGLQNHILSSGIANIEAENGRDGPKGSGIGHKIFLRGRWNRLHGGLPLDIAIWLKLFQCLRSALLEERRQGELD